MIKSKSSIIISEMARAQLEELQRDMIANSKSQKLRSQLLKFMKNEIACQDFDLTTGEEKTDAYTVHYETVEVKVNEHRKIEIFKPIYKPNIRSRQPLGPNPIFIRAMLPPEMAEDAIANNEHYYESVLLKKHEAKTARIIFYAQNARIVMSHYIGSVRSALELYLKFKK